MKALFMFSCTLVLLGLHATLAAPEGSLDIIPDDLTLELEDKAEEIVNGEVNEEFVDGEVNEKTVFEQIMPAEEPEVFADAEEEAQVEEEFPAEPIQHEDMDLLKEELVSLIEKEPVVVEHEETDYAYEYYDEEYVIPEETSEEAEMRHGVPFQICHDEPKDNWHPIHLSHPSDCGKFYKCFNGLGFLMKCPNSEHWSVALDRCDYPPLAKCVLDGEYKTKHKSAKLAIKALPKAAQANIVEDAAGDEPLPEIDPRCPADGDPYKPQHLGHPTDCTKFYKCYLGRAYVIKCPRGQQWFKKMSRCDHPAVAKCVST